MNEGKSDKKYKGSLAITNDEKDSPFAVPFKYYYCSLLVLFKCC
jgi:hypothetical protein